MCDSVKENDSNLKSGAAKKAVITKELLTAKYKEEKQILVNYMPPINVSVNELSTVKTPLRISLNPTRDLGQVFTFVTFDIAVVNKRL